MFVEVIVMKTKQQQFHEPIVNCTFRVPQSLYKQVKTIAIREQKSISLWINEALEKIVKENQDND
jgi:predicted HicB family RNase H-like nuclease